MSSSLSMTKLKVKWGSGGNAGPDASSDPPVHYVQQPIRRATTDVNFKSAFRTRKRSRNEKVDASSKKMDRMAPTTNKSKIRPSKSSAELRYSGGTELHKTLSVNEVSITTNGSLPSLTNKSGIDIPEKMEIPSSTLFRCSNTNVPEKSGAAFSSSSGGNCNCNSNKSSHVM